MSGPRNWQPRSRRLSAIVAVALGALVLGGAVVAMGSGGSDSKGDFDVAGDVMPLGQIRAGSVASLVDCDDWNEGPVERQQATVIDIREQLSAGGTIAGRPSLADQEAFDLFERACAEDFTGAFRLYKLYYQANAFSDFDPYQYSDDASEAATP